VACGRVPSGVSDGHPGIYFFFLHLAMGIYVDWSIGFAVSSFRVIKVVYFCFLVCFILLLLLPFYFLDRERSRESRIVYCRSCR
jgi:hypothetical protein